MFALIIKTLVTLAIVSNSPASQIYPPLIMSGGDCQAAFSHVGDTYENHDDMSCGVKPKAYVFDPIVTNFRYVPLFVTIIPEYVKKEKEQTVINDVRDNTSNDGLTDPPDDTTNDSSQSSDDNTDDTDKEHSNNGNHYGNSRPDNNPQDVKNKHNGQDNPFDH